MDLPDGQDPKDITAAGLFADDGGRAWAVSTSATLRHDGPEHVLCFAPTRSGKGVGLVSPKPATWPGSAIVHDIKGENWQLTSGWRGAVRACPAFRSDQCGQRRLQSAARGPPR